jgi:hypothetical protein
LQLPLQQSLSTLQEPPLATQGVTHVPFWQVWPPEQHAAPL